MSQPELLVLRSWLTMSGNESARNVTGVLYQNI